MKLVSAAKLRKAQTAAENGQAFISRLEKSFARIMADLRGEFSHPLLESRAEVRRRLVIAISGDRGLCGAFNSNVVKAIQKGEAEAGIEREYVTLGRRISSSARKNKWNVRKAYDALPESAADWPVEALINDAIKGFLGGEFDEVVLYYNEFVSVMTQNMVRIPLLPLGVTESEEEQEASVIKYSPDRREILGQMLPILIRTRLKQAALESKAGEHASRMTAMDSATSNATELIGKLKLTYNRARQSAITTELIDIVGGAEAVK